MNNNNNKYIFELANIISLKSPDPKKQVGCILVSPNGDILSLGYNRLPKENHDNIDWSDRKYIKNIIIHAEMDCLTRSNGNISDCILYCTLSPCTECFKLIMANNISTIYFIERHKTFDSVNEIAKKYGINLIEYLE